MDFSLLRCRTRKDGDGGAISSSGFCARRVCWDAVISWLACFSIVAEGRRSFLKR